MTLDLRYYFAIFLRRLHYFFLVAATIAVAAITAAFTLPPAYVSEASLLMESSQIPDALAAPTVNTAAVEQLQIIEQRLMTRANLLDIANRLQVFKDMAAMTPDEILAAMRTKTRITSRAGRDQATRMTISFEAEQARTAAAVVNEYVTLILRDNVTIRTDRAQETLQFFQQEVDRLNVDLSNQSARILNFKNANADALPDTLDYRLSQQSNLQERQASVEREITSLNEQKVRLVQIFNSTGRIDGMTGDTRSPEARQLDALRDELASALAIYSVENPKVKMLQARVTQLESIVQTQDPVEPATTAPEMSLLDIQLAEIDSRVAQLGQQRDQINAELDRIKETLDRSPANAIALEALTRDYENVQTQYNTAVDRLAKASTGERIEVLSKGQRIAVLDSATVPNEPTKPNRLKIAVAGVLAGIGMGVGVIVLFEMLNNAVRRPSDLVRTLGITPIGTIPYLPSPGETRRRKMLIGTLLALVILGLPAAIYAVHTYYQPLDLVLARIQDKIGL